MSLPDETRRPRTLDRSAKLTRGGRLAVVLCIAGLAVLVFRISRANHADHGQPLGTEQRPTPLARAAGRRPPVFVGVTGTGNVRPAEMDYAAAKGAISDCWNSKVCPNGTACWLSDEGGLGCFSTNCSSAAPPDGGCGPDEVCATIDRRQGIRRCVKAGTVPVGGLCRGVEFSGSDDGCAAGAVCWRSHCRRLCNGPADCGQDACVRINDADKACVPSCADDAGCKGGQKCVATDPGGARTCVHVQKGDGGDKCRPDADSCTDGQRCEAALADTILISTCRPACDNDAGCPAGAICALDPHGARGLCVRRCRAQGNDCVAGETCVAIDAQRGLWGCRLVPFADRPGVNVARGLGHFSDPVAEPL